MNVTAQTITIEPITGRYMRLEIHGRPHRLYWEGRAAASRCSASTPPAPTGASSGRC